MIIIAMSDSGFCHMAGTALYTGAGGDRAVVQRQVRSALRIAIVIAMTGRTIGMQGHYI